MWSPTVPLSVENEAMVGAAGATVSTVTLIATEAALVTPDTVSVAVKLCSPSGKGTVTKLQAPLALAVARAEQRRPVVHIHRCVRHRRAGQRQDRRIGDAVADNAGVRRERGNGRSTRWRRNCHRQGRRRRTRYCRPHRSPSP